MNRYLRYLQRFLTSAIGAVAVLAIAGTAAVTVAQSSLPRITSVTVNSVTNVSASISFSTDVATGAKILYGKTTAYGSSSPVIGYSTPAATNHVITLDALEPSTTYHFQVEVNNGAGTTKSADRTFTTRSGTGSSTPLVLNNIVADCVDTRCQIQFTPNREATVRIVWDNQTHAGFSAYPAGNIVAETGSSAARRGLVIPVQTDVNPADGRADVEFTAGAIYYYRLQAFEPGNPSPSLETSDLQFRTGLDENDHTFSTGGCTLPPPQTGTIAIGQCGPGGYYCPPGGGEAVLDCTKSCGYVCPASSTCRSSGVCEADPSLSGSPLQCNKTSGGTGACYDDSGNLKIPAPAGCYGTWGKCNANTILKVRKDRGCNLWLTCATSVQTEASVLAPAENLCLTLAACNSLNQQGQCNSYLPQGQCDNDPLRFCATDDQCAAGGTCNLPPAGAPTQSLRDLTFTTPDQVKQIANLSGNVVAGLDWNEVSGSTVIQGNLPWQVMRQIGGDGQIINGDLEYNPPSLDPWITVPKLMPRESVNLQFEDQSNSINHILKLSFATSVVATEGVCSVDGSTICLNDSGCVSGVCAIGVCSNDSTVACSADSTCGSGNTCNRTVNVPFGGVATNPFTVSTGEAFYAEVRLRADVGQPTVRVQFGHGNYSRFSVPDGPDAGTAVDPTFVDVELTSAWRRVTLGPIVGMTGETRLGIVCADNATCDGTSIFIDDVQVKPVLQVNTNPTYITPSCRLYPRADSPACDYFDQNGVLYKGWKGYCLENDSVTGTCLSWWPVDIIRGETSLFGVDTKVGYQDQVPLFLCAEAAGRSNGTYAGRPVNNYAFEIGSTIVVRRDCCDEDDADAIDRNLANGGIAGGGNTDFGQYVSLEGTQYDDVRAQDLYGVRIHKWDQKGGFGFGNPLYLTPDIIVQAGACGNILAGKPWGVCWSSAFGNGPGTDTATEQYLTFALDFDTTDGHLKGFWLYGNDGSSLGGSFWFSPQFILREQCTKLVEVVTPEGANKAYGARINSSVYRVESIDYTRATDALPYGAVVPPDEFGNDPTLWPPILVEQPNTGQFSVIGQSRASSPYACEGNCSKMVCNINPVNECTTATKIRECQEGTAVNGSTNSDINGDGVPDGQCIGVQNLNLSAKTGQVIDGAIPATLVTGADQYFALQRIRRLFTESYGVWDLGLNGRYSLVSTESITPPTTICPQNPDGTYTRPNWEDDFCGIPPKIISGSAKFLSNEGTTTTITGGSGSVGLKFNTDADAEQMPLDSFIIAWGDSESEYPYRARPKNDPANPHIFSHVYNNTGPTCTGSNTSNCCTITNARKTCNYEIRVLVKDNWGWCNNATSTGVVCPADRSTWYDTGLRVRVEP